MANCGSCGAKIPVLHVGDFGTEIIMEAKAIDASFDECVSDPCNADPLDISTATDLSITFQKPDGSTLITRPAAFVTDGTDGKYTYTIEAGILDEPGGWIRQGRIVAPSFQYSGPEVCFEVGRSLNP